MSKNKKTPDHSADIKRINRMIGQLEGIKRMIEEQRYCQDILTQTKATSAALKSLETSILGRHMNHCVAAAFETKNQGDSQKKIDELMEFFSKRMN